MRDGPTTPRRVLVRKLFFGGRLNWELPGYLLSLRDGRATVIHPLGTAILRDGVPLGFVRHRALVNYLWFDRWYGLFDIAEPRGLRHWYGNVQTPAVFDGDTISYVDLDLDVVLEPGAPPCLVDEDEFLEACERLRYPAEVVEGAWEGTACLLRVFAGDVAAFLARAHLGQPEDAAIAMLVPWRP
jgi:hypothetical protein